MMDRDTFLTLLQPLGLPQISPAAFDRLAVYAQMLCEKNRVMNLTAIREDDDVFVRHFVDSLAVFAALPQIPGRLIDVGCGGGFPGLPLKILFDDLRGDGETQLTLLDATKKKIDFLSDVCRTLGLKNVTALSGRAEDVAADPKHREQYDLAVSRAVADLRILGELCLPFVKLGGHFAPHKSDRADDEIAAAALTCTRMGGKQAGQFVYTISPDAPKSRVLIFEKQTHTPAGYPRPFAKIKTKPLK